MKREKRKKRLESRHDDLKRIIYDEAFKLAENPEDARALAEEAFTDFQMHLQPTV